MSEPQTIYQISLELTEHERHVLTEMALDTHDQLTSPEERRVLLRFINALNTTVPTTASAASNPAPKRPGCRGSPVQLGSPGSSA